MTVSNFPAEYWSSISPQQDGEFLEELQILGARIPEFVTNKLWSAFMASEDVEERRAYAVRIVAEFVQIAETFCLLVLAMRTRSHRSVVGTFVDHGTAELRDLMNELGGLETVLPIGELLQATPPTHGPESAARFEAVTAASHQLIQVFNLANGAIRRFYNKSKHGLVLVRSANEKGPPFYGPNPDAGIYAITRPAGDEVSAGGLVAVGFRADPPLVERLVVAVKVLSGATFHLAGLIRGGIEQHAI